MGGPLLDQRLRRYLLMGLEAACLLAFAGYRIGAAAAGGPAVWQDSEAYKAVGRHGLLTLQLWAGARSPLVPVLMKLTGSYGHYILIEGILGALAWSALAFTVGRTVPVSWRSVVLVAAVLGFASSPLVVMWDGSALSESPSLSMLALLCAAGIWLVRRFTWPRLAALGAAALCYCGLRDADIWTIGLVGLLVLGAGLAGELRGLAVDQRGARARAADNWRRARAPVAVGGVLLLVAALTGVAAESSHRNLVNVEEAFYVRVFPYPARVAWFTAEGMPEGRAVDAQAGGTAPAAGSAPVVGIDLTQPQWAPLRHWFQHDGLRTYAFYLALHPGYVLTAPFDTPRLTFNDAQGDITFYRPAGYALAPWADGVFTPNRFVELSMALAAVLLATYRRRWRSGVWRFVALFAVLGLGSMLLSWHGEGQEVTRHMVEGNVEVRLGVLLALALAVLGPSQPDEESADVQESVASSTDGPNGPVAQLTDRVSPRAHPERVTD